MSNGVQALSDAEHGVGENVYATDFPSRAPSPIVEATRLSFIVDLTSLRPNMPFGEKCLVDEKKDLGAAIFDKVPAVGVAAPQRAKRMRAKRWMRFKLWYNTYRKFFTFVITFNSIGLLLAALNIWTYPRHHTGVFFLGNLLIAIVVRNELFGRFLHLVVNTLFSKWTPLWWRLGCTSVLQHLGGIHSGCATSSVAWLIFRIILDFISHNTHGAILITGLTTNVAAAVSIGSALPWVRNSHHNVFERHHRFAGWFVLLSAWAFVILSDIYDPNTKQWDLSGSRIISQQASWLAAGTTVFALIPWLTLRKVKVDIEIPSPKVAILRFERGMQQGLLARISRSPIVEYHLFGVISEGPHAKYHYLICGVQGDFTRSLVNDPPSHLWTRQLKLAGVSTTLYRRGIRVCTGTGLGGALSTCLQSPNWYLIWIGSDQEKTFGPTISELIHRHIEPERMCLWDSKQRGGRPDMMQLVREAYHSWKAEVVFITSNFQGNQELMEGCEMEGIPAFGTLWDF